MSFSEGSPPTGTNKKPRPGAKPRPRRDVRQSGLDRRAEAAAEGAEVDGVHAAGAVGIERRIARPERRAERAEIDLVHRAGAVRVAEEAEQLVGRVADQGVVVAAGAVAVAVERAVG